MCCSPSISLTNRATGKANSSLRDPHSLTEAPDHLGRRSSTRTTKALLLSWRRRALRRWSIQCSWNPRPFSSIHTSMQLIQGILSGLTSFYLMVFNLISSGRYRLRSSPGPPGILSPPRAEWFYNLFNMRPAHRLSYYRLTCTERRDVLPLHAIELWSK